MNRVKSSGYKDLVALPAAQPPRGGGAVAGTGASNVNRFGPGDHRLEVKRCRRCGVRKAVWAFYREKSCRGGRRPECKRCHARWRRERYRPKTGRRYVMKADRAARAGGPPIPTSDGG